MDLAEKLDPAEVLAHLKQMGYHNITPEQLKEFMKDLKKLIVYDQLSSSSGSLTSLSSSAMSDSEYYSASETSTDTSGASEDFASPQFRKDDNRKLQKRQSTSTSSLNSRCTERPVQSSMSSSLDLHSANQKENRPPQYQRRAFSKTASSDNLIEAVKPKTSFIRPWRLQGSSAPSRTGRSDPVSLYRYYQSLWSQRKCPGEDSHADLRWVIRERMLGQDPRLHTQSYNAAQKPRRI